MIGTVAAMCDAGVGFAENIENFEFVEAFVCQYGNTTGFTVLALFVWSAVSSSIYIRTGSFLLPFGLLLMVGGAALSQMASVAAPFAVLLILVVPSAVTVYLYITYSR